MTNFAPTIHPWNQALWQQLTIEPARANHALLFTGDPGLGKQSLAFALAHFIMCDNHSQSESLFNAGSHPDLHVLMPEFQIQDDLPGVFAKRYIEEHSGKPKRNIPIDQIRKLGQALTTHPHIGSTRIILIYSAEHMNNAAANALLKNLEEPPANTLFILVTDEVSRLSKTIRSRCSLINFRAPDAATGKTWLQQQGELPAEQIESYLAMANNHPLQALKLFRDDYIESLKSVFNNLNSLWSNRIDAIKVAKNWQTIGGVMSLEILQKLTSDLLRSRLSDSPRTLFFPVQQSWVKSVSEKLSKQGLVLIFDELNHAKKMLNTTVDELLVLETVSNKFRQLPV